METHDGTRGDLVNGILFPEQVPAPQHARHDRLTFKANRGRGRHGWLRLTPAYSIHLVEERIARLPADALVLDPFCGSGTTALACAQYGVTGHTVDINPFLVWLATAKCAAYAPDDIESAWVALGAILRGLDERRADAWTPPIHDITKWWDAVTLSLLAQFREGVMRARLSARARDLLLIIFCRLCIEVASVSFGHQSMSFKKGERAGSYRQGESLFPHSAAERVTTLSQRFAQEILGSASDGLQPGLGQAFLGDARDLLATLPARNYSVVLTSPPYPNRMSYIRELRPYMYWLGYLETGRQAGELDWQAIGGTWGCATSNLTRWTPTTSPMPANPELEATVAAITQRSALLGAYVAKYFADMDAHIASLRAALAPGAQVSYIVGNSKFYDVVLPTEQLYAAMLCDHGFTEVTVEVLRKRTSKRELFEYEVSARWP